MTSPPGTKSLSPLSWVFARKCKSVSPLSLGLAVYDRHLHRAFVSLQQTLRLKDARLLSVLKSSNSFLSAIIAGLAGGVNVFLSLFPTTWTIGHLHKAHGLGR